MRPWRYVIAIGLLFAGCSLRDVDRYSAGSESIGGTGGCKNGGESCIDPKDCCSGTCNGTCSECKQIAEDCNGIVPVSGCCDGLGCREAEASHFTCQPVDACTGAMDGKTLAGKDMSAVMRGCKTSCEEPATPADCTQCVAIAAGISDNCANCYKSWWTCLALFCNAVAGIDCQTTSSDTCNTCCAETCKPTFSDCSGRPDCPLVFPPPDAGWTDGG